MKSLQLYGRNDMVNLYKQNKVYGSLGVEEQVKTIDKVVTGEQYVVLTECVKDKFKQFKLLGNSVQETTTGKNLLSNNPKDWNIGKGISWSSNKDDPINTVNTLEASFIYLNVKSNTKYSFINLKKSKIWVTRIIERNAEEAGLVNHVLYKDESMNKEKYTFTTTTETKSIIFQIKNVNTNNAMTETDIKHNEIMFYEGENVPYEPYTGGKPSPSPEFPQEIKSVGKWNEEKQKYEIDVQVTGKNLLDISACEDGKALDVNGDISNNANALLTDFIQCFPKTPYCRPKRHFTVIAFYDLKKNKIGFINQYDSCFTTPNKCRYFRFALNKTNADYKKTVVNVGKELAEYEPYREPQTVKLSLDQPLRGIGEYKDVVTKDCITRKIRKILLNGSEDWYMYNADYNIKTNRFYTGLENVLHGYGTGRSLCNKLKPSRIDEDEEGQTADGYTLYVKIEKEKARNVEEFKQWLLENPLTVLYVLDEPVIEELPEENKLALESLHTNEGTTVIAVDGGEVKAGISVTYKSYGNNIRSETNV